MSYDDLFSDSDDDSNARAPKSRRRSFEQSPPNRMSQIVPGTPQQEVAAASAELPSEFKTPEKKVEFSRGESSKSPKTPEEQRIFRRFARPELDYRSRPEGKQYDIFLGSFLFILFFLKLIHLNGLKDHGLNLEWTTVVKKIVNVRVCLRDCLRNCNFFYFFI
jgi:hypothetical protein